MTTSASPPHRPTAPTPSSTAMFAHVDASNTDQFSLGDWGLFLTMGTIWGSSFLLIDIGLDALPPGVITLVRVGLGALTLNLVPGARVRLDPADRARMVALALLWVAVPFTLFPLAEQHINSAVTGLLNGGTPIFTAVVATILVRHPPGRTQAIGILVGFVGIVAISLPSISEGSNEATGVAMVIGATVCYGFALNIAAPLQASYGAVPTMARALSFATVAVAPFGLVGAGEIEWEPGPIVAVAVLGVIGTGVAFAIMATLVGRVGSTRASFITYVIPVVSLFLGVVFRHDVVRGAALAGVVLVIVGAFLASRRA